jgi:hypothetical protein
MGTHEKYFVEQDGFAGVVERTRVNGEAGEDRSKPEKEHD